MGRAIAIANQKGGVGKSTTAINLSSCLGAMGQKVLTIDLDPQGNTTSGLGVEKDAAENTVYELLLGECEVEECLQKLEFEGVSLIPSNVNLAGAEIELIGIEDKEFERSTTMSLFPVLSKDKVLFLIVFSSIIKLFCSSSLKVLLPVKIESVQSTINAILLSLSVVCNRFDKKSK